MTVVVKLVCPLLLSSGEVHSAVGVQHGRRVYWCTGSVRPKNGAFVGSGQQRVTLVVGAQSESGPRRVWALHLERLRESAREQLMGISMELVPSIEDAVRHNRPLNNLQ